MPNAHNYAVVPAKAGIRHHGLWNMGPQHKRGYARLPPRYARGRRMEVPPCGRVCRSLARRREEGIGRCGALLPLFRLVGVHGVAALWRVESLPRHRGDRPKIETHGDLFDLGRATGWLPGTNSPDLVFATI